MSDDDLTPAEKAYRAAQDEIARVKAAGEDGIELELDGHVISALTEIPPEIATLTKLIILDLHRTKITELAPIASLSNLSWLGLSETPVTDISALRALHDLESLHLWDTNVSDLNPLRGLTKLHKLTLNGSLVADLTPLLPLRRLTDDPDIFGLTFDNTPATQNDPKIAEISEVEDHADRARQLFDYLTLIQEKNIPPQSQLGLPYKVDADGQIAYQQAEPETPDLALAEFHPVVLAECHALMSLCQSGRNIPYKPLGDTLERYHTALGTDAATINPAMTWKLGNDLRLTLKTNAERRKDDLDDMPPLGIDLRNMLDSLVQSHNVMCELHPRMKLLDTARIDSVDRHEADQSRDIVNAALAAFSDQVKLLRAEIISDLQDINREARSDTQAALRAMKIEQESLENLVKAILVQGIRDSKDPTLMAKIGGDMRGAAVGTVFAAGTTVAGPEIAATYPALVAQMQPYISALLSAMHGSDYPLADAVQYLTNKVRRSGEDDPPE